MAFDDNNPDEVFDDEPETDIGGNSDEQSNRSFRMMMIGLAAIGGLGVLLIALIFVSRQNQNSQFLAEQQRIQQTNAAVEALAQITPTPLPTDTPAPTNTAVATNTPASTATPAPRDLVDTALSSPNFRTLASLLQAAGLSDDLKAQGPFTLFAPTDDAFAQIAPESLEALRQDPAKLEALLKYHVVQGAVKAADVAKLSETQTLEGEPVAVAVTDDKTRLNDATITQPDLVAANGVIHTIDRVLIPPELRNEVTVLAPPTTQPGATQVAGAGTPATGAGTPVAGAGTPAAGQGTAIAQVQGTATRPPAAAGTAAVPTRVPPQAATATAAASKGITGTQTITGTASSGNQGLPSTGAGDNLVMWLLAAAGLVGVLVVARRMRTAQS